MQWPRDPECLGIVDTCNWRVAGDKLIWSGQVRSGQVRSGQVKSASEVGSDSEVEERMRRGVGGVGRLTLGLLQC